MATHSSILARRIHGERSLRAMVHRVTKSWAKLKQLSMHEQNRASQVALVVKNLPPNAGDARDMDSIPGLGRSPGGGNGNPL